MRYFINTDWERSDPKGDPMTLSDMLKELPQYGEKLGLKMRWASMGLWLEIGDLNDFGIITPNGSEVGNAPGKEMLREALVRLEQEYQDWLSGPDDPNPPCSAGRAVLLGHYLTGVGWTYYTTENVVKAVYEAVKS